MDAELILKVGTTDAVQNVADLRDNIRILKENLKELEKTQSESDEKWQEYQQTLKDLETNQEAVRNAMHATSGTFTDVQKNALGLRETYNGLVAQMKSYKSELRNTDVSTEAGKKRFAELAEKVNDCNSKLKALDAEQGNFQRNVGNYQSAFKGLGEKVDAFKKGLEAAKKGVGGVKDGFDGLSKSAGFLVFGLLVNAVMSLAKAFKETDEGMETTKAAMVQLEPIMNFFKNVIATLAEWLGDIIGKVGQFLGKSGLLQKIIGGVMGVGNAIVQYVISPFKAVIAAIKVFKEQGIKGFKDAAGAFADEMKNGLSFKKNFEAGQAVGDAMTKGVKKKKADVVGAAKEVGEDAGDEMSKAFAKAIEDAFRKGEAVRAARQALQDEWDKQADDLMDMFGDSEFLQQLDDMPAVVFEPIKKEAKLTKDQMVAMAQATVSSLSNILNTVADLYEDNAETDAKAAAKVKGLRIASATIDTLQGAVTAFASAMQLGPIAGPIVGAVNAAAVTAAGIANIAKIKATPVPGATGSVPSVSAPSVPSRLPSVRQINTQSEEERLNQMASDQRVYILSSDIQASQTAIRTQVAEASF